MSNIFYVYLLLDPKNLYVPFYVGKGKLNRYKHHFKEKLTNTTNVFKYRKIQRILNETGNMPPVLFWSKDLLEDEAYHLETQLIERFGRHAIDPGGILTNQITDGRPPSPKGKKRSPESIEKFKETHRKNYRWRPLDEGHKAKIGDAHRGTKRPQTCCDNISKANKGRSLSADHRKKISEALRGRPGFFKGKKHSAEAKAKMKGILKLSPYRNLSEVHIKALKENLSVKMSERFQIVDLLLNETTETTHLKRFAAANNLNYKSLWQSKRNKRPYLGRWLCTKL